MARKTNKNENPLRSLDELADSPLWRSYPDRKHFLRLCTLAPNFGEERLDISKTHDDEKAKQAGLVYVLVVKGKIFKIGQSITPFFKRLSSYNTGKGKYRSRGTNSGANYFILQSLINLNVPVEVYAFFPEHKKWTLFDEDGTEAFPSAKVAEKILLKRYVKKYGKKPLGCTQG